MHIFIRLYVGLKSHGYLQLTTEHSYTKFQYGQFFNFIRFIIYTYGIIVFVQLAS